MTVSLPHGYSQQIHAVLDSTNEEAKRQILSNADLGPTWIQAHRQTAGRGRRGNIWASEPGNLFCSLVLPLDCDLSEAANLSFVAALAVGCALEPHVDPDCIGFKWPNDVLLDDRKVAGILLDVQQKAEVLWLIVGIGVNIVSTPDDVRFPATALNTLSREPVSVARALHDLTLGFDQWLIKWREQGFPPVRQAWLERAARINMEIEVRLPHETAKGIFRGLDQAGALRLGLRDGEERLITAGDVYFAAQGDQKGSNATDC